MPDPTVLAFDTSAAHCAAALLKAGRVAAALVEPMQKGQAERLLPMLEELLAEGNASWSDLTSIGVGIGPGNFTGTRIAVSAARGLALGLGIPAVGVSAFEATAFGRARPISVAVPAPRDHIYVQSFDASGETEPRLCPRADVGIADAMSLCLEPRDLVIAIAQVAARNHKSAAERPAPLYVRPADAAPPREAPPAILP
ncbi:MAG: tRNA (adenosine(37)-N6)-threonylcarbamoyltransferase complex dimerization subunit type 1 TsaB [Rhodobacter sp.]|nr:tRNA (adenosine(37)-N6)-threonylcarbamoyltransferase complex dimerization subunit type 1 TsaB [Rhodobacter sp.]